MGDIGMDRETMSKIAKLISVINERVVDYRDIAEEENVEKKLNNTKKSKVDQAIEHMDEMYEKFGLHQKVVAFFNGRVWNVVQLDSMLKRPILVYKHWSDKDQVYYTNSLFVCPLTLRSMIYKGKVKVHSIKEYEITLLNEDTGDTFPISNPYTGRLDAEGKEKAIKSHVKRHEVKILEHRDIFAFDSDPTYVVLDDVVPHLNKEKHVVSILMDSYDPNDPYLNYYTNRIGAYNETLSTTLHPKSLLYMVQYYSKSDGAYRHLVLISSNIDKHNVTGYKYKLSKVWKYTETNKDNLIEKRAFTYPILWFALEKLGIYNYDTQLLS